MALSKLPVEVVRAFVEASCREQGVQPTITNPRVLESVLVLLKPSPGRAATQGPAPRNARGGQGSDSPADLHPGGIEAPGTLRAGSDRDLVHDGANDGVLPVERQTFPCSA